MTVTRDVLTGWASEIAGAGIALWQPSGVYQTSDTAIFLKTMPDGDTDPDRCVVLNLIPLTDDIAAPAGQVMVQVAYRGSRGDPADVDDLADSIFTLMQGRTNLLLGTTRVTQVTRKGSVPMGQDTQGRWTRADKYFCDITVAATTQRPNGGWA